MVKPFKFFSWYISRMIRLNCYKFQTGCNDSEHKLNNQFEIKLCLFETCTVYLYNIIKLNVIDTNTHIAVWSVYLIIMTLYNNQSLQGKYLSCWTCWVWYACLQTSNFNGPFFVWNGMIWEFQTNSNFQDMHQK